MCIKNHIKAHVASVYKIPIKQLEEGKLWFPDIESRYICFWLYHKYVFNKLSYNQNLIAIGREFNGTSRSTINYGIKKINEEWLPFDKRFESIFSEINIFIKSKVESYEIINN